MTSRITPFANMTAHGQLDFDQQMNYRAIFEIEYWGRFVRERFTLMTA